MLTRTLTALLFLAPGVATAAEFPTGTFAADPRGGATWTVTFWENSKFTLERDGRRGVEGSYTVDGNTVELTDMRGSIAGVGPEQSGTYRWKAEGKQLTLTPMKDRNDFRKEILSAGPLEKTD